MRLGAYSGVMSARIAKEQESERPGGAAPSAGPRGEAAQDPNLLGKLAGEGWLEHNKVEKG